MDAQDRASVTQMDAERILTSRHIELEPSDPVEAIEFFYRQGWTDGLPVVPPTPEMVVEFLEYAGRHSGTQPRDYGREGGDQRGYGGVFAQLYACDCGSGRGDVPGVIQFARYFGDHGWYGPAADCQWTSGTAAQHQ